MLMDNVVDRDIVDLGGEDVAKIQIIAVVIGFVLAIDSLRNIRRIR